MREWPIRDVAQATGLTSRTLRYYEQVGLLRPSRVASNGYRFYGEAELSRLYRVLSLRALGFPLATIQLVLRDDVSLTEAIASHLACLQEQRDHLNQQIRAARHTLEAATKGTSMSIEEVFAGIDLGTYEAEVRERWGDEAWEQNEKQRERMSPDQRQADDERTVEINGALRDAATAGEDPAGIGFQSLIGEHHRWVSDYWGGRIPDCDAYSGLAELYVADVRFAAVYGGQRNAEVIREAMRIWISTHLE